MTLIWRTVTVHVIAHVMCVSGVLIKIIFVAAMASILAVSLWFVFQGYQDRQPESRHILDDGVLLLYPSFTEVAYAENSFYAYYDGRCDESCLTKEIDVPKGARYVLGKNGYDFLYKHFNAATDIDIERGKIKLSDYHIIVLFHNEYVTSKVYKQITDHPNVVYLYPNALYAEITFDGRSITLVRGHGYPDGIANGFDWPHDNTEEEKDCTGWSFRNVTNGIQLDCYPENIIRDDKVLQQYLIDYLSAE